MAPRLLHAEPRGLIDDKQAADEVSQLGVGGDALGDVVLAQLDELPQMHERRSLEGHLTAHEQEEGHAGGPHVHLEAREGLLAGGDLGRLEGGRATALGARVVLVIPVELLSDAKVAHLEDALYRDEQVGRLDVAVHDAAGMAVSERVEELVCAAAHQRRWQHVVW